MRCELCGDTPTRRQPCNGKCKDEPPMPINEWNAAMDKAAQIARGNGAYDDGLNSPDSRTWSAMVPIGPRYHHDDVVREPAETLERAEMMMRMRGCLEMANECAAALAKIAQEGKP